MKRFLLIITGALVVTFAIALAAPGFVDWNKYKSEIIEQASNTTGYAINIGGNLSFSVLPSPRLVIETLDISAPGSLNGDFISLDKAEVVVALLPLLKRDIVVSKVLLVRPDITLVRDEKGAFPALDVFTKREKTAEKTPAGEGAVRNVALQGIQIKQGRFHFTDRTAARDVVLDDIGMFVDAETLKGPFSIKTDFSYAGKRVDMAVKTGRLVSDADSLVLQADISLPETHASLSYSGVVGLTAVPELQGELELSAPSMLKSLEPLKLPALPALDSALALESFLTLEADTLDIRDIKGRLSGQDMTGHIKLAGWTKGVLDTDIVLDSNGVFDAASWLADDASGEKARHGFLPETLTLPFDVTGKAALHLAGLKYEGKTFRNLNVTLARAGDAIKGRAALDISETEKFSTDYALSFGALSRSSQDRSVTFSDPKVTLSRLSVKAKGATVFPLLSFDAALQEKLMKVDDPIVLAVDAIVSPDRLNITGGRLAWADTAVLFSGAFAPGRNDARGALQVNLENDGLDIDKWLAVLNPVPEGGVAPASTNSGAAIGDIARGINLPLDIAVTAQIKNLKAQKRNFPLLELKAAVKGKALHVDNFTIKDEKGSVLTLAGGAADYSKLSGLDFSLEAKTSDMAALPHDWGQTAWTIPEKAQKAELLSVFKGDADSLDFTANVGVLNGTLETKGTVATPLDKAQLSALTLRVRHPDYVDLLRVFVPDFARNAAIRKDVDIFATLERDGKLYNLSGVQAKVGPVTARADMKLDMAAARPHIEAHVHMGDVPLDKLTGHESRMSGTELTHARPSQKVADPQAVRWSRRAIDVGWMQAFDLDLSGDAAALSYEGWRFENADLALSLKNGLLTLDKLNGGLHGGQVSLNGKLRTSSKARDPLTFSGAAQLKDVSLESLVKSFSGARLVKAKGAVSMDVEGGATGLSPAALIFDLHGKGAATGQDITFEGFDLAKLSRALAAPTSSFNENFGKLLDATSSGGTTQFDTLDSAFTITEGVVNFDKLLLDGPAAAVTGTGNVNLPLWTVDLKTLVSLKEPADAPTLETVFKGPLDSPGKTFGQNAMQQYFNKQLEGMVLNPLIKSLEKKGILQAPLPPQTQQKTEGEQQPAAGDSMAPDAAVTQPVAPKVKKPETRQITPEEALFGILQGVIEGAQ